MPEEYKERRQLGRQPDVEKRMKIANHDWRYSSQERRLKHEPMLHGMAADRERLGKERVPRLAREELDMVCYIAII